MKSLRTLLLATLAAFAPSAIAAQSRPIQFSIAAGLTLPNGAFADRNDVGYNAIVGLGMMQPGSSLGFRAEGIYNEFNKKDIDGKSHAGGVTGNVVYNFIAPTSSQSNTAYAIGGIGYYSTREPFFSGGFANPPSRTDAGFNVGAGFRFPLSGFSAYAEARYHSVSGSAIRFLPISFGLVF
ncbi:MAG TPA: outer membrane beta-barrel protein [Gemmatimonadaceae bacterium]|nr:outer membrane beta-barrel protein [Gemmatimonadaceae bacterium]